MIIRRIGAVLVPLVMACAQSPHPNDARGALAAAIAVERSGKTDAAIRQFHDILRSSPPVDVAGQARLELVRIFERRDDWWEAASQWEELRKLAPNEPEYAYQLGVVYRNISKWAYEQMRSIDPGAARLQQLAGEQYSATGDNEKAIAAFKKAIAKDPNLEGSHLALAVIYLRGKKRDEALAEIDKELALAPESAVAHQVKQAIAGAVK